MKKAVSIQVAPEVLFPADIATTKTAILGVSGSGKTNAASLRSFRLIVYPDARSAKAAPHLFLELA